jgi:hypothetical protein
MVFVFLSFKKIKMKKIAVILSVFITILGLYAKGKAKKDTGGFIIKTIPILAI